MIGVTFKNEDGTKRQKIIKNFCFIGQEVIPIIDNKNKFSKNAVGLFIEYKRFLFISGGQLQIGHLGDKLAKDIIKYIKKQEYSVRIHITDLTGGGWFIFKRNRGVNIYIQIEKKAKSAKADSINEWIAYCLILFFIIVFIIIIGFFIFILML